MAILTKGFVIFFRPSSKCWDSILKWAMITSFHALSKSDNHLIVI